MTQRFDPSLIHALTAGSAASTPATPGASTVAALVDEAICRAVDFIAGGDRRSARVNVTVNGGGFNDFAWILLDTFTPKGASEPHYTARTNDIDLMCATPPSFHIDNADPGEVHEKAAAYLAKTFEGKDITVRVFCTEGSVAEPTVTATSTNPEFVEETTPDIA
jgi:hypothetical protein